MKPRSRRRPPSFANGRFIIAKPVESVGEAKEALLVSLNERGRVDLDHMAALLGKPTEEFLPDLKGIIFLNPLTSQWETDDQYLSGNVREKFLLSPMLPPSPTRASMKTSKR